MTDFAPLIPDAQAFFTTLEQNNAKAWWQDHKTTYDTKLKAPAQALLDELTPPLADLAGAPVTGKIFRPHRDVRFSKDKTPYKTHLHMMWSITGDARQMPVFFFGIGIDYVTTGVGIMGFDKDVLADWRTFVDLDTKRILGIVAQIEKAGFTLGDPALKRVPPAYAKDHPAEHLLRMKGVIARSELQQTSDLPAAILDRFRAAWPLNALLIQIAES
ncbi:DUF2461 domain-containing protein [Yoonia sp. 208BN28-4]|uniref:DUF2461 domain-containing protein n=1 Tax=Yoonia sp. 208BN28-4 TaxID=3126505 RepID=UPI0030A0E815